MIRVDEADPIGEVELSFPYRDVLIKRGIDAKEFYDLQSEIGRGKFGTVYRCREKSTGRELAAKFVPVSRKEDRRNVEREVDIMKTLQHPRLIQLYDAFDCGKVMCVVLELIDGGELFERVIDDDFILTEKSCTVFMRQICEGIEYVHRNNILHLDMKPENILCLTKTGNRIKIIDFGLARRFDPDKKLQVLFGTPEFVAPEVVNFDQIGYGTDMWSVGVICYVLLSGLSPFMGETDVETMANVTIAKYDFNDEAFDNISDEAKDFIRKLLLKDKKERMSASECLEHKWLRRKSPAKPPTPSLDAHANTHTHAFGLDTTKDNLRLFVERWAEHPNSPYLFDVSAHVISPLMLTAGVQLTSSQHSLRGMSPSPCGSLNSSPDSVVEFEPAPPNGRLSPTDDSVFHHYTFNTPPTLPSHIGAGTGVGAAATAAAASLHVQRALGPFEFTGSFERRASDSSCIIRKADIAERINLAEEIRKLSDKLFRMSTLPDMVDARAAAAAAPAPAATAMPAPAAPPHLRPPTGKAEPPAAAASMPWRRTKFKVTGMSRDVPLNSYTKSAVCTELNGEAAEERPDGASNTKDLLLKLLDKWSDTQDEPRTPSGRHKSISAEWSEVEQLGQRTISSLNTFFQSRATTKKTHPFMTTNGVK